MMMGELRFRGDMSEVQGEADFAKFYEDANIIYDRPLRQQHGVTEVISLN